MGGREGNFLSFGFSVLGGGQRLRVVSTEVFAKGCELLLVFLGEVGGGGMVFCLKSGK